MLKHNFCWPNGRLVKLLLFSTLLDKSPLTFIYLTTFESKRKVRSPLPHTTKLFGFRYNNIYIFNPYYTNIEKVGHMVRDEVLAQYDITIYNIHFTLYNIV